MLLQYFMLFSILIAGHFVCDYTLQTDAIARGKNRNDNPALFGVPWYYWLAGHSSTHALMVGIFTHNVYAGVFEFVMHSLIDFGKCEKKYGIHVDQALHTICKLMIVISLIIVGE